jgi:ubiquinone/menaquinone biosynthesis C-methylase UbiE/uncharacterized protein YbaR (Trm112 family)
MVSLQDLNAGMTDCGSFLLVCPICRGELILESPYRRLGRVRTGELHCLKGCAVFPIVYGVPVMLLPGQPADFDLYKPTWRGFLRQHGKQKLIEALAAGEFDTEPKVSGPSVGKKMLGKAKRVMSKAGWQRHLERARTSSKEPDAVAIAERLQRIESGVMADVGCGGGFTTERVLQETQPSVSCIAVDIDFECVKTTCKRVAVLGMSDRCIEICADVRRLPFADKSLAAAYTRNGFSHVHRYVDSLKEAHRTLKRGGRLISTDGKFSMWREHPDRIGISYEEQYEILRHLGLYVNGQEFIKHVKRVGFDILAVDDLPMPKRFRFLVEAVKN